MRVCVCMYVCMRVCMYVCVMYVCIYVCMYVCMYACVYVCMCVCMYVCVYVCMYVCVYVCMWCNVCMYVCTYVCLYVCVYVCNVMYVCMHVCMCVCVYVCMCVTEVWTAFSLTEVFALAKSFEPCTWEFASQVLEVSQKGYHKGEAYHSVLWAKMHLWIQHGGSTNRTTPPQSGTIFCKEANSTARKCMLTGMQKLRGLERGLQYGLENACLTSCKK